MPSAMYVTRLGSLALRIARYPPPAHPLLLLCFGYDPDEGTAAALAMQLVRWVSLAVVVGCVLLVALLSLRRRSA